MKQLAATLLLALSMAAVASAETMTHWWGLVSFRQRHETTREFYDVNSGDKGELLYTTDNSTTRLGYQFGVKFDIRENLYAGLTFRSGLSGGALVMQQDITSREGLLPGIQEAYINWKTPFVTLEAGKIPQAGTAMWDVYAASLQNDFRADDPRDGIFNDRMAALNGVRVSREVAFFSLRGLFHNDYVAGFYRDFEEGAQDFSRSPDRNVSALGATISFGKAFGVEEGKCETCEGCKDKKISRGDMMKRVLFGGLSFDFDYGFPHRAAMTGSNPDSVYADEDLYGFTLKKSIPVGNLQVGYGYNWRDSVFTMSYWDILATANVGKIAECWGMAQLGDLSASVRYQTGDQELEFDPYKGMKAERDALHLYLNKTVWGLDLQPRLILFDKKIEGFKQQEQSRFELTATARF